MGKQKYAVCRNLGGASLKGGSRERQPTRMFGHPGSAVLEKLWTVLAEGAEGKASFEHEVGAR